MTEHKIVDAIRTMIERFGPQILAESNKSMSMLKDLAPSCKNEIILLKHAFDNNLVENLVNAASFNEQQRAVIKMYYTLTSVLRLSEDAADEICNTFINALELDNSLIQSHKRSDDEQINNEKVVEKKESDHSGNSVSLRISNSNNTQIMNPTNSSFVVDDEILTLDNSALQKAIIDMRANFNPDTQNKVINTALRSRFILPYLKKNSNAVQLISKNKNQSFVPVFSNYSELKKSDKLLQTVEDYRIVKFSDIAAVIENMKEGVEGFVIDPMSNNLPFTRQMLSSIKDTLIKYRNNKTSY